MNFIGTQTIETKRLILRKINLRDTEDMFKNWASDEDVAKYLTWQAHKDVSVTKTVIESFIERQNDLDYFAWCIEWKENHQVIGTIDIVKLDKQYETAEMGYCISREYWGKGIMTEALLAVEEFLFDRVDLNRIQAKHHVDNPASGKVMSKCGMQFEGVQRKASKDNMGDFCDVATYAILKSDWENARKIVEDIK